MLVLVPACGNGTAYDERPVVVATTTILGDVIANIVGDDARLDVLMPTGADPHDFEPSSQQTALLATADLVVSNGLGLEEGLEDIFEGLRGDGVPVLEVAPLVDPLPFGGHNEGDEPDGRDLDPHFWLDPLRVAAAARSVADRLAEIESSVDWQRRAESYARDLIAADQRISALLEGIALEGRLLVTNHDALGYFADRYGFEVIGVVVPGGSTLGEPGSQALRRLVAVIDEHGVPAIFADTTEPTALAEAIASEADHPVSVVILHTGSLGEPGTAADTLIGMLEENARLVAEALG